MTIFLPKVPSCKHCGAYRFYRESDHICCSRGEITLAESELPPYLVSLITGTSAKSKEFQNMIRTYNNHFAFTSIGISCDGRYQRRDRGIYTVKVQGQVHHYLDDLFPQDASKRMKGIQFYFYDSEHQVSNRISTLPRLDVSIVENLVEVLESNPYGQFLKQVSQLENIDQYCIVIRSDPGLDQRRYNKPLSNEVAAVWIEDENDENVNADMLDIRVYTKSGRSHSVEYYYGCYDPLQYVLMFPRGEPGWHSNIPRVGYTIRRRTDTQEMNITNCGSFEEILAREQQEFKGTGIDIDEDVPSSQNQRRKRKIVSSREYYVYKLQDRINDKSYILRFGRLFQQYIVDNYIKIESMWLRFLITNQKIQGGNITKDS
ncbi:hypothetical protein LIER_28965 [Lithospermum erythrorhizon]|uniref:Helitron helicase-like domain-containing protein n=1 Tax=Lithospermum erythrorhizon TaxID=34254 RepID=A0AAV3RJ27_LITER